MAASGLVRRRGLSPTVKAQIGKRPVQPADCCPERIGAALALPLAKIAGMWKQTSLLSARLFAPGCKPRPRQTGSLCYGTTVSVRTADRDCPAVGDVTKGAADPRRRGVVDHRKHGADCECAGVDRAKEQESASVNGHAVRDNLICGRIATLISEVESSIGLEG